MLLFSFTYKSISLAPHLTSSSTTSEVLHLAQYYQIQNFSELSIKKGETTMISTKRIAQMAKKWQRMAALGRKRLMWTNAKEADECCSSVAVKGHCIMYSVDGKRFKVPLAYLGTTVFTELLRMSQEEFGFTSNGRITLPCDALMMEYVMCMLRRNAPEEVERAFLSSVVWPCHHGNGLATSMGLGQQVAVSSF